MKKLLLIFNVFKLKMLTQSQEKIKHALDKNVSQIEKTFSKIQELKTSTQKG